MDEKEFILRRTKELETLTPTEYADHYRTKDMYCAAFLVSRGYDFKGLEEAEIVKKKFGGKETKKKLIFFVFPDKSKCEHTALNYFNQNRTSLNVNANAFVQSILSVRSIITNPPF